MKTYTIDLGAPGHRFNRDTGHWEPFAVTRAVTYTEKDVIEIQHHIVNVDSQVLDPAYVFFLPTTARPYTRISIPTKHVTVTNL